MYSLQVGGSCFLCLAAKRRLTSKGATYCLGQLYAPLLPLCVMFWPNSPVTLTEFSRP